MNTAQRVVLWVAAVGCAGALLVGLIPVSVNTARDNSYDCGSPFFKDESKWTADTFDELFEGFEEGDNTPDSLCPDKVNPRRTLAFALLGISVGGGLLGVVLLREQVSSHGTTNGRPPGGTSGAQPGS